jgi:soluble lytic murein transglycosylase-like protein
VAADASRSLTPLPVADPLASQQAARVRQAARRAATAAPGADAAVDQAAPGGEELAGLRRAAREFESLFYGQLLQAMRSTVPENGFWGQSGGTRMYRQMHDEALAEQLARTGGLGIADLIVQQFQGRPGAAGDGGEMGPGAVPAPTDRAATPAAIRERGLAAYRAQAVPDGRDADLARLRRQAAGVGGAAADSLQRWQGEVMSAADATGLEPGLVLAVMVRESAGDPQAVSPRGARGLMQLMPATATELGVRDPHDPAANLHGGARYLARMLDRYDGDLDLALAAYNAGPGNVDRAGRRVPEFPETQHYVAAVKDLARRLGAAIGTDLDRGSREIPGPVTPSGSGP